MAVIPGTTVTYDLVQGTAEPVRERRDGQEAPERPAEVVVEDDGQEGEHGTEP